VFTDDEGAAVGAGYATDVGDIDLLASDRRGDLVVVMISEKEETEGEDLVSEVLRRLGWVRKHLGGGKKKVRGIVLCVDVPEDLSYAAAAVIDTVAFKTYRVALTFEDLEV
jgi:RecB family endonuclease NucS